MIGWMLDKLWIASTLESELGVNRDRVLFSEHHLSHAASAFLCSPFEESAILTVDGVGEWLTAASGVGRGTQIQLTKQIEFPHSIGLLYSAFTAYLGFEVNEGEYKVMGMAPYGQPKYLDKVWKLITLGEDGSFRLNMEYFTYHHSATTTFGRKFVELFGPAREPGLLFFTKLSGYPSYFGEQPDNFEALAKENQHYADVASSIQKVTEEVLLHMARALHKSTGKKRLCMAGGVALNSVANSRILRETPFEELYIQPAAGDSGGALGAALYAYHVLLNKPRNFVMDHAYWGKSYSEAEIKAALDLRGVSYEYVPD